MKKQPRRLDSSSVINAITTWAVAHAAKPPCNLCGGTGLHIDNQVEREAYTRLFTHVLKQALDHRTHSNSSADGLLEAVSMALDELSTEWEIDL